MKNRALPPARIALVALLIAITVVFTLVIRFPLIAGGYLNLSDVAISFIGFIFGPWIAAIAGGVGTALADLQGYPQYAPFSLLAHGLEGLIIGLLAGGRRSLPRMLLGWFLGSLAMIGVYFVADRVVLTGWTTWAPSIADLPGNAIQAVVGIVGGLPLTVAMRRAYPPIDRVGRPRTWSEK